MYFVVFMLGFATGLIACWLFFKYVVFGGLTELKDMNGQVWVVRK